jgi:hypothetical protein
MRFRVRQPKNIIVCLFFAYCLFYFVLQAGDGLYVNQPRYMRCHQYLLEGTLYGGQLECEQPPLVYVIGALTPQPREFLFQVLLALINTITFIALTRIYEKKTNLYVKAFLFAIFIPALSVQDMPTSLMMLFGTLALKAYTDKKSTTHMALLLFLGIISKATGLISLASFLVLLALDGRIRDGIKLASYVMAGILALIIIWPNMPYYTVIAHQTLKLKPLEYVLMLFSNALSFSGLVNALIILSLAFSRLPRNVRVFSIIVYAITFYVPTSYFRQLSNPFHWDYFQFAIVLLILALSSYPRKYFTLIAVAAVSIALITHNPPAAQTQLSPAEKRDEILINGVLGVLPSKTVLTHQTMADILYAHAPQLDFTLVYSKDYPPDLYRFVDEGYAVGLILHNISNRTLHEPIKEDIELAQEILDGNYDLVIIGVERFSTMPGYAVYYGGIIDDAEYCKLALPIYDNYRQRRYYSVLVISKDEEMCREIASNAAGYTHNICPLLSDWGRFIVRMVYSNNYNLDICG